MDQLSAQYLANLQMELERCCAPGYYNTYKDSNGKEFTGGGESHVKQHLTSSYNHVSGRQFRFPGIANGWNFEPTIKQAGYCVVEGINYRGQTCRVVIKKG